MTKQLDELTIFDVEASPYWMFYSGPEGEYDCFTTVIPVWHPEYGPDSVRLIRAIYTLSSGVVAHGLFYEDPHRPYQHLIFVNGQSFWLWSGAAKPSAAYIAAFYAAQDITAEEAFPIAWETHDGEYSGVLPGFGHYSVERTLEFDR